MCLIEAIHQGADLETIDQCLQADPELLNRKDAQGNTPLHYAVARHNLALIECLIKRGAQVAVKNLQEETAADWFQEYIASRYIPRYFAGIEKCLYQEIIENNVQFITDGLKDGLSRALRFSRGRTLLHFVIEAQQKAITEAILKDISYQYVTRLLNLKDSQGVTPLVLAEQLCRSGRREAQEIFSYLQERQRITVPENTAPTPLTSLPELANSIIKDEEIKALADYLCQPLKSADFVQQASLKLTVVGLAYRDCRRALENFRQLSSGGTMSLRELFQGLFGGWNSDTYYRFYQKLRSVTLYLANLIQQQQVDQIIQFSAEKSPVSGCCRPTENKIILNVRETSVVALVVTLIHEVTHKVDRSYDFFTGDFVTNKQGCLINLRGAFQLAAIGKAKKLTPEQRKIFEVRQLLKEGFSDSWQQNLYRWMALNSAETLAVAIVALAAVPQEAATIRSDAILLQHIRPQFLQGYAVAKPSFIREVWNRISPPRRSPNKDPSSRSAPLDAERPLVSPVSPETLSTASGGSGSSPNTSTLGSPSLQSESFSLSPLPQAMAAQTVSAAAGPSGLPPAETPAPLLLPPLGSPSKRAQCPIT